MNNLKNEILKEANNEKIEVIVIGEIEIDEFVRKYVPYHCYTNYPKFKVLTWEEAEKYLDYEYLDGIFDCHSFTAWTKSKVIFTSQYDGNITICSLPRNPVNHIPFKPGG